MLYARVQQFKKIKINKLIRFNHYQIFYYNRKSSIKFRTSLLQKQLLTMKIYYQLSRFISCRVYLDNI